MVATAARRRIDMRRSPVDAAVVAKDGEILGSVIANGLNEVFGNATETKAAHAAVRGAGADA